MNEMTTQRRTFVLSKILGLATVATVAGASFVGLTPAAAAVALPTTTSVTSSLNPSVVGDPVTFTATVVKSVGVPLGTVQFMDAGSLLSTVSLVSGSAQYTTSSLTAGTHDITAKYVPDPLDLTSLLSLSSTLTQVVNTATGGGGGGGGGGLPVCLPGQTTPTPTISAPARVVGPQAVTVHGTAAPNDPVDLFQQTAGSSAIAKVGSTTASATGAYSFSRNVSKQATFVARDKGVCGSVNSAKAVTKVAIAVTETVSSPKKGRLRLRATTAPRVANQLARFYRVKKGGTRVLLAKVATGAKGVAHKTIDARSGKRYRVLVTVSAPPGNLAGTSKAQAVTVR